ncbi:hypothetical protein [Lysinibacter cavernae]|uniref:Uridine kinase n=1 Tax=Lysinibacter cavernae TaxID=1640652 RepID=A0A7X5QZ05_9MICO|nr:hypothetical protein [Lysinibacter cavernae]NIH52460.1 uridine kinase [Lysinibacter cavernae]
MNEAAASGPKHSPGQEAALARQASLAGAATAITKCIRPGATVLIDGRSGSGKTEFARSLVAALIGSTPVVLVSMDDVYPGWDGLATASESIVETLLLPRRLNDAGSWRRFDWHTGEIAEQHRVEASAALIVEGCGSLSRASHDLADFSVWLDAPADVRRTRALGRDGAMFEPQWEAWAAQEEALYAREGSRTLADVIVETSNVDSA